MKIKYIWLISFILLGVISCNTSPIENESEQDVSMQSPLDLLNAELMKDSTNAELYNQRAMLYLQLGMPDKALLDVSHALEWDPANAEIFLTLAEVYYAMDQTDNVQTALLKASELSPDDPKPYVKLAELNLLTENITMALGFTDKALNLSSYNPEAYYVRGIIFLARQDTLSALKNLQLALDQDEEFYDPMMQLGKIYAAQSNELAALYYKRAIQMYPERVQSRYELALFLQDNEEWHEALAHYDSLLLIAPNNKFINFNIGYVYLVYEEDFTKAIEYFDEALLSDPNYIDALYNKGRALEELGRYSTARDIYNEVLERETNYQLAIDALNRLDRRR